jgi:PAS domain S-box-containing protein
MGPLSDELLARIVALAADAIICIDSQHRITFFNDGAVRIFGYHAEEILGQPLSLLIPQRFGGAHRAHIEQFGKSPVVARQMGERSLISGVRKGGEEFPAEAAIAKMVSADGPIYSVVLRDVTEQRRTDDLNRQLLSDTEAAVKARDEVLGIVSHDLRNPVNAVKMLAAAILRTGSRDSAQVVPEEVVEHATVMLQAANQMDALIQDLLDVTRLESGRMQLSRTNFAVANLVSVAVDTLAPQAAEQKVRMVSAIEPGLPHVFADADRIMQVLSNLIGNALKFSKPDSVVRISAHAFEKFVAIEITDTGAGIAPDELPFVFDRFWQSRRTNRSGAGLGLAIARGIVHAHDGEIKIVSEPGKGTTVRFTLPTDESDT